MLSAALFTKAELSSLDTDHLALHSQNHLPPGSSQKKKSVGAWFSINIALNFSIFYLSYSEYVFYSWEKGLIKTKHSQP